MVSLVLHIFVINVIPPVFKWTFEWEKEEKAAEIPAKLSIKLTQIMPNGFTHIMGQVPLNTAGFPGLLLSCKGTFIDAHISDISQRTAPLRFAHHNILSN